MLHKHGNNISDQINKVSDVLDLLKIQNPNYCQINDDKVENIEKDIILFKNFSRKVLGKDILDYKNFDEFAKDFDIQEVPQDDGTATQYVHKVLKPSSGNPHNPKDPNILTRNERFAVIQDVIKHIREKKPNATVNYYDKGTQKPFEGYIGYAITGDGTDVYILESFDENSSNAIYVMNNDTKTIQDALYGIQSKIAARDVDGVSAINHTVQSGLSYETISDIIENVQDQVEVTNTISNIFPYEEKIIDTINNLMINRNYRRMYDKNNTTTRTNKFLMEELLINLDELEKCSKGQFQLSGVDNFEIGIIEGKLKAGQKDETCEKLTDYFIKETVFGDKNINDVVADIAQKSNQSSATVERYVMRKLVAYSNYMNNNKIRNIKGLPANLEKIAQKKYAEYGIDVEELKNTPKEYKSIDRETIDNTKAKLNDNSKKIAKNLIDYTLQKTVLEDQNIEDVFKNLAEDIGVPYMQIRNYSRSFIFAMNELEPKYAYNKLKELYTVEIQNLNNEEIKVDNKIREKEEKIARLKNNVINTSRNLGIESKGEEK